MKSKKRILCLLLSSVLLIGILAACSDDDSSGKVTITYSCPQVVEGYDYNPPNGDGYSQFILEKFNIDFQGINVPWGEWHNMLSTWIMAQDMPDVIIYNYGDGTHSDAQNFVSQGLIKRLPDDWKTRWPNVAGVYASTSLGPMLEDLYGGTYFIPRARFYHNLDVMGAPLANHWSLWYRTDWVAAVGGEVKNYYTIPEVLDLARKIKEQDPGGLGANLVPISMDNGNTANFFLRANSTYWDTFYKDSSGTYQWGAAAPETLEGLKYWYQAYSEGILDPEYYLLTYEQDMEKFQTLGVAGFSYLGGQTADVENYRIWYNERSGLPMETFGLATLLGADGYYHQRDLINFWGAVAFSPDVEDEVFERWMDLMEFTASWEGYPGTSMGVKGEDWDFDDNGEIISLIEPGVMLAGAVGEAKYPSLGHVLGSVILWDDLALNNPNIGKEYREESEALYRNRSQMSTPETFAFTDWNLWTHSSDNLRRARGIAYADEFSNLVTSASSEADLVSKYNAWLESQMAIIQPVLDELN